MKIKKKDIKNFTSAFLQVSMVSANVYFVSNRIWFGIALTGFFISYLWAANVKRISISNDVDRVIYALGAMCGSLTGVGLAMLTFN